MTSHPAKALELLWGTDVAKDRPQTRFLVLPSSANPRLVLPTRPHRAAAVLLNALRDQSSARARLRTRAARARQLVDGGGVALSEPAIIGVISDHLPGERYAYGAHLGPPRANRKPVVALATPTGTLTAFAKVGVNTLTDRLVRREAAALPELTRLDSVRVPRLLGHGDHRGHPYVVQSPVPTVGKSGTDPALVVSAQVEVAAIGRDTIDVASSLEQTCLRWTGRIEEHSSPDAADFSSLAHTWATAMDDAPVPWGSWHGDWRVTNMTIDRTGCSVWDWERFATGVPAGYDALHLHLTSQLPTVESLTELAPDLFANAPRLLRPFGVVDDHTAALVTTGYLLELAGRYLDDDQAGAGARLGSVGQWLLPALAEMSTR